VRVTSPGNATDSTPDYATGPGVVRPFEERDVDDVLELNELEVEKLAPMDEAKLREIHALADRFDVIELDGSFVGFVITVRPGSGYWSDNYQWYVDKYGDRFYYLDRVVMHERARGRGLGSQVYDALEERARPYGRLALEVNVEPPNEPSLAFHRSRGYEPVGEIADDDGHRRVMLVKELGG
jgi:predicted GNAT superfamily acetyltransferase